MPATSWRVLVVDDHPLMREAISATLMAEADLTVVGQAPDGREAVRLALQLQPDVIIMDLAMPRMGGLEAIRQLCQEEPTPHILALTSSTEETQMMLAVQAGALGYLVKEAHREEFLRAVRQVAQGQPYLPASVALTLLSNLRRTVPETPPAAPAALRLTARQREIFQLLGQGLTNRQIARRLSVSEATVRSHVLHILQSLNLESRNQAVAYAARHPDG